MGSWVGVLSVVSRSSLGKMRQGIREVKEAAILKKWELYMSWHYNNKIYYVNDNADNNPASPTLLAAKEYKNQQP